MPVFVDSPLAIKATEIFRRNPAYLDAETKALFDRGEDPFGLPNLQFTQSTDQSREINTMAGPAIVISASGMPVSMRRNGSAGGVPAWLATANTRNKTQLTIVMLRRTRMSDVYFLSGWAGVAELFPELSRRVHFAVPFLEGDEALLVDAAAASGARILAGWSTGAHMRQPSLARLLDRGRQPRVRLD